MNVISGPNAYFASRLLEARRRANKTQEQVAAYCGIASRNISLYESGHSMPRSGTLQKLADFLETDAYFLAHGRNKETDEYLENQNKDFYKNLRKSVNYLYINDWDILVRRKDFNLYQVHYCESPTQKNQSNDLSKFIPYLSAPLNYLAVRLPIDLDINDFKFSKDFEQIIIINTAPVQKKELQTGTYVLYAPIDKNFPPRLGLIKKEVGEQEFFIESVPNGFKILEFDANEYEILGQIEAFITRKS